MEKTKRTLKDLLSYGKYDKNGCLIWQKHILVGYYGGYGIINWEGKVQRAHRLVWTLLHGPIPDKMFICHKCDVKACINPNHLFLGTPKDNTQDMIKKGRIKITSKITEKQVKQIKKRLRKEKGRDLAKEYGISPQTICDINKGRIWKNV